MTRKTHYRACHLCEAICGLVIETEGADIVSIKGDKADPLSRGHICPKAIALKDLHTDPDRLRAPVKRVRNDIGEDEWQEISWDEALDTTATRLAHIIAEHGVNAVGIYMGNPSVHNYGMMTHQGNLFQHIRSNNRFSATSVDQLPHHLTSLWLYGYKLLIPVPDVDNTDYLLMLGANPLASNGSIWTVPDVKKRLKALTARDGKLVVVDPRKTETAGIASEHFFIRPGTDALFLLALLHTLFTENLTDPGELTAFTSGLDEVAAAIAAFTPEFAAAHTGIEAEAIRRTAREFAAADKAVCYGRMGVSTQAYGALCQWLIQLINIATGNLDRPGGSMFASPAVDTTKTSSPGGHGRHLSRVRSLPEFDRELPAACLAEEISTPGEGQIRALFTGAGNPVLSTPNGRQLDSAMETLEFMVSLDPYINETTRHADIILPPTSPLEHDQYDISFHLFAVRNTARYNEAVFDKPANSLHDWEIFNQLGNRLAKLLDKPEQPPVAPHEIIDMGLQMGAHGAQGLSLEKLRQHPSGIDLGPLQSQLPARLATPQKTIQCDIPQAMADLHRLFEEFQQPDTSEFRLIGRRHVRSNNSWMHNYHRLMKGRDRCTLMMHPEDMVSQGIAPGARATLSSRVGSLSVEVEPSDEMMPGVVSLPHGFGHTRKGIRLQTAVTHAGVSCNDVTDEHYLDVLSGNAAVNGVPVTVRPA
ncbi:MAG: molybdopterin oxidoreductase family protein [Halioglobus sp.]|nr:molybdopterin oxidoreductase family protein [Halioglobus sp.]